MEEESLLVHAGPWLHHLIRSRSFKFVWDNTRALATAFEATGEPAADDGGGVSLPSSAPAAPPALLEKSGTGSPLVDRLVTAARLWKMLWTQVT